MSKVRNQETPLEYWELVLALLRPAYSVLGDWQLADYALGFALPFKVCRLIRTPAPSLILGLPSECRDLLLAMRNSLETRRNIQSTRGRAKESKLYEAPMNREEKGHTSGKAIWRLLVLSTLLCATLSLRSANAADGALTVPRGTILPVRLNSTISSDKSKSGQVITGRIMQDVPLASGTVLRAGSKVIGHILDVSSASNGGQARVSFQFDKLIASGRTIPIRTNLRAVAGPVTVMQVEVSNEQSPRLFFAKSNWW